MNGGPVCTPSSSPAASRKLRSPGLIAGSRSDSHMPGTVTSRVRAVTVPQNPLVHRAFAAPRC